MKIIFLVVALALCSCGSSSSKPKPQSTSFSLVNDDGAICIVNDELYSCGQVSIDGVPWPESHHE